MLFCHPASFTPVCTTEFIELARRKRDFDALGVPAASYLYQVEVFKASGRFSDVKRMTLLK